MIAHWVKCSTTTTGTGTLTLASVSNFPSLVDLIPNGAQVEYSIVDSAGVPIESGIGTLDTSAGTLARSKVIVTYVSGVIDRTAPAAVSLTGTNYVLLGTGHAILPTLPQIRSDATYRFCHSPHYIMSTNTQTLTAGTLYAVPWYFIGGRPVDALALEVGTLGASSNIILGLYTMGSDGYPSKKLVDSGAMDSSTTGVKVGTFSEQEFPPGWYWMLFSCKTANVGVRGADGGGVNKLLICNPAGMATFNSAVAHLSIAGWDTAWTTLPATAPTGWTASAITAVFAPIGALRFI